MLRGVSSRGGKNHADNYGRYYFFPLYKLVFGMDYHRQQGDRYKIYQVDTLCGKLVEAGENREVDYQYHSAAHAERSEYPREERGCKRPYHCSRSLPPEIIRITPNILFNRVFGIFFISSPPKTAPASPNGISGRASPHLKLLL